MIKRFCDLCGKEIEQYFDNYVDIKGVRHWHDKPNDPLIPKEICWSCYIYVDNLFETLKKYKGNIRIHYEECKDDR